MKIREPRPNEIPSLVAMVIRSFESTFRGTCADEDLDAYMRQSLTEEAFAREYRQDDNRFLIATDVDSMIGMAKLRSGESESCVRARHPIELQRLYVDPDRKGKGVGTLLMNRCVEIGRNLAHDAIWLGVWEHNLAARNFYERNGFIYCGSHDFIMGNDVQTDLIMQRDI